MCLIIRSDSYFPIPVSSNFMEQHREALWFCTSFLPVFRLGFYAVLYSIADVCLGGSISQVSNLRISRFEILAVLPRGLGNDRRGGFMFLGRI